MTNNVQELITLIDKRIKMVIDNISSKFIKQRIGTVVSYDNDSKQVAISFPEDDTGKVYNFYNKTGESLQDGDNVRILYTTNVAKGWVGMKLGESTFEETLSGVPPITNVVVNSNFDFTLSTNSGTERYIAVEET